MWADPGAASSDARGTDRVPQILYLDTEGFEAAKKADAYDDRIFALSTIVGSLLIYNLPETIKEADIEKLSFAGQLADVFYADATGSEAAAAPALLEPAALLWLIQRDFLTGSSVADLVREALAEVPNPQGTRDIDVVNQVRRSLRLMSGGNSTAFGLRQPHMDRTRLCSLRPEELDPTYNAQMAQLRQIVRGLATRKVIRGRTASGADLARLIRKVVAALNSRDIPSAGAVVDSFNLEVMARAVALYESSFDFDLPVESEALELRHGAAAASAMSVWKAGRFRSARAAGGSADPVEAQLQQALEKAWEEHRRRNELASSTRCDDLESACDVRLPS